MSASRSFQLVDCLKTWIWATCCSWDHLLTFLDYSADPYPDSLLISISSIFNSHLSRHTTVRARYGGGVGINWRQSMIRGKGWREIRTDGINTESADIERKIGDRASDEHLSHFR